MTGSRVALTERGPGAKRVSSQNRMLGSFGQPGAQQLECMASWRQRLEQHTSCVAEELEDDGIHTIGIHLIERVACSRASHATVRTRATRLRGYTRSSPCERSESVVHASVRGKRKHRENDGLENGTYRTRPRRHASQLKFTCKASGRIIRKPDLRAALP
jgi:hypothetical protein